jgi:hypothetical protein
LLPAHHQPRPAGEHLGEPDLAGVQRVPDPGVALGDGLGLRQFVGVQGIRYGHHEGALDQQVHVLAPGCPLGVLVRPEGADHQVAVPHERPDALGGQRRLRAQILLQFVEPENGLSNSRST